MPSIGVGTDSRLLTLETIGIKTFYVKDATAERLEAELETIIASGKAERERLRWVRETAIEQYSSIIRAHALA